MGNFSPPLFATTLVDVAATVTDDDNVVLFQILFLCIVISFLERWSAPRSIFPR